LVNETHKQHHEPDLLTQVIEVYHGPDRSQLYLVCLSKCYMSIYEVSIAATPKITLCKQVQLDVECICNSVSEHATMFMAQGNKITKCLLSAD